MWNLHACKIVSCYASVRSFLTYVANHSSTVTAWLRVLASAHPPSLLGLCLPVPEDTRLCDDAFSVACRIGDKALEDDGIVPDVLPVLSGCRAEVHNVCAGEVLAKYGQQLVL
jgi:hypothetical protein